MTCGICGNTETDHHCTGIRIAETITPRAEVQWFAQQMEKKLLENDHKPHWRENSSFDYLFRRLGEEREELKDAIINFINGEGTVEEVVKEAADNGNFSMMIADLAAHVAKEAAR